MWLTNIVQRCKTALRSQTETGRLKLMCAPGTSRQRTWWEIAALLVMGVAVSAGFGIAYFMYQHIYAILNNTAAIVTLSSDLNFPVINVGAFLRAEKNIAEKKLVPKITTPSRNVFNFAAGDSAGATTTFSR